MAHSRMLDRIQDRLLGRESAWTAFAFIAAVGGAAIARNLLKAGWRTTTGREPPENPATDNASWKETLIWAVLTGALVGIARAVSRRGATSFRRHWS